MKDRLPFTTIKCPVCHKGVVPFPLDNGFRCCRNCGATRETIDLYIETDIKIGIFILKYILPIILLICLISHLFE